MFHTELYTYSCRILSPYNISFIVVSTSMYTTIPSQPFNGCIIQVCISCTVSNWITSHKCNTSQRFITVFTICIHILGIWSPYNLSFIGCFVEFMYTIINHFKPLRSFYDCFYKSMHFLYKITSHKLQYFHLDSTVYHLSPFSQPYHVAQQALS